jgi:hypothetical protein
MTIGLAAQTAAVFAASYLTAVFAFWGTAMATAWGFRRFCDWKGVPAFVALLALQTVVPTLVAAGPLSLAPRLRRFGRAAASAWGFGALCGLLLPGPIVAAYFACFPVGDEKGFQAPGLEVLHPVLTVYCGLVTGSLAGLIAVVLVALRFLSRARCDPSPVPEPADAA